MQGGLQNVVSSTVPEAIPERKKKKTKQNLFCGQLADLATVGIQHFFITHFFLLLI